MISKALHLLLPGLFGLSAWAQPLRTDEVAAARTRIWAEWQQTQQSLRRLAPLVPLDSAVRRHTAWQLSSTLEPNARLRYVYGAKGERPAAGYPLFLYLHGSGAPDQEWRTGFLLARQWDDAPSAYFIPRIPNTDAWYRWYQQSKQSAWELLLRQALASGQIDPDRLYVSGISEGGYGTQRLAAFYGDYWAGAGAMAGGEPLKNAPVENYGHLAFSFLTGAEDRGFYRDLLTGWTGEALDSIRRLHPTEYVHRVQLIAGAGHGIDYSPTTPWLARHRRTAQPRHFIWEDFPMQGRYRTGFYNLRVDAVARPAMPSPLRLDSTDRYDATAPRRRVEMDIRDNVVRLDIDEVDYATTLTDSIWGIALRFRRTYRPAREGRYTVFLSEQLVDLARPVRLVVNGRCIFHGRLTLREEHLRASLHQWGDPRRLFPAALSFQL